MSSQSLKNKAIKGVLWSAVDKLAVRAISFAVSIIIARILSPDDYGIIGMIAIFMALSSMLVDSGFSQALVQKHDRSQTDFSTAFFFNIIVGIGCYIIIFAIAPLVGEFYNSPTLIPILRVLGLTIIINSLCTVQRANLLIKIDFKTTAKINVLSLILSGTVGIWLAYAGFGVWALVFQSITQQTATTIFLWLFGRWRPTAEFSTQALKRLFGFGSKLLVAGSVATVMREVYSVVIGKFYLAAQLGFYTRAVQTTDLVSGTVNEVINSVTFPLLSSMQQERERMIKAYSKMLSMTALIIFPIMTLLAVVASPLVEVLLTEKWMPAVPLLQWLCFARMFTPISSLNMNILNAIGRSDLFMKLDLSKMPLTIVMMIITLPISVEAVVIGNFIATFICYFINAYLPGKLFGFGVTAQFKIFWKIIIATAVMAILTIGVMYYIDNSLIKLIVGCCSGVVFYYLCGKAIRISELKEVEKIIINILKKRS